ncbi:glycosyltransferase [Donghicola sp. C2-DW-16]|uniref:Glycosyltransferase n=1 Tax=Donghicola mangrovi TaxID=2729614 RepID=A0ABX2PGI7_9RHOB|nr:ceramide glucosyltransferase [Donghicola mangrovi]NVO28041.1 glycosyltransferase [Donghicola mangrovi]
MTTVLMIALVAAVLLHLATVFLAAQRYSGRPPVPAEGAELPPLTLLRPVCGVDAFDEETLRSSFLQDYPDYEIIFCAARADDPACALVQKLMQDYPQVQARLMIGESTITGNPKVNNMHKGYDAALHDHIVMTDSNLMLPPDYLRQLVARWTDDSIGLVTAPAAGNRAVCLWGALECAFLNTHQGRWQLAADAVGLGYAQGKTLFGKRSVIEAGGGLAALGRDLAEDVAMTKLIRGQNKSVRLTQQLFFQPIGKKTFKHVWARQVRWSQIRKQGFLHLFLLEMVQGPVLPIVLTAVLIGFGVLHWLVLPALLVLWYGAEWALARRAGWPCGTKDIFACILRDALIPAIWCVTWTRKGLVWRGNAVDKPSSQSAV